MIDEEDRKVVAKFFAALEACAVSDCGDCMSDSAVVWHNYDEVEQPREDALAGLAMLAQLKPAYQGVRRTELPDGCIQQHVAVIRFPDGTEVRVPAIQRVYVADGAITRIEEYMDSAAMGAIMQKMQSSAES